MVTDVDISLGIIKSYKKDFNHGFFLPRMIFPGMKGNTNFDLFSCLFGMSYGMFFLRIKFLFKQWNELMCVLYRP